MTDLSFWKGPSKQCNMCQNAAVNRSQDNIDQVRDKSQPLTLKGFKTCH